MNTQNKTQNNTQTPKGGDDQLSKSLEELEKRVEKIQEAQTFLEDIEDRLYWALDFGQCNEATAPINNIIDAINYSQERLQKSSEEIEEVLNEFKEKKTSQLEDLNLELSQELTKFST
jgi:DNA repair ATPase RecN